MLLLAIDPGQHRPAWLLFDTERFEIVPDMFGIDENAGLESMLRTGVEKWNDSHSYNAIKYGTIKELVVEMIEGRGHPVGQSVLETCVWIGRFESAFQFRGHRLYRRQVKLEICGSNRARDSNVRAALIDMFPPRGQGTVPQVGTKKVPGPLYGMKRDLWQALGLAVAYCRINHLTNK